MLCNQRGIVKNSEYALMHPPNISEPVVISTTSTSLLEPCSSSSLDTTPEINPTDVDIAEACEFALSRTVFGNDLSVLANNAAVGNSSEERNGVEGIGASPTEPGRVSTLPSSRVAETSNPTITISDGDHSSEIIVVPDRQSPSSDSRGIEQSHSPPPAPPPSVASASFVSGSQPNRDEDYESEAYFVSSSSSDFDPDDDTGIFTVEPRGRLAAALTRDFPEPSTEAWYAIGQQGAHSTAFISTLGRTTEIGGGDNGVNDQSPLAAASESESVSRGATPIFDEQLQRVSPQTGGGRSGHAQSKNNIPDTLIKNGMSQDSNSSEVLPPGERSVVSSEGHRRVRRYGIVTRRLALRVLPPLQPDRDPIMYLHNAIRDIWTYVVNHANDTNLQTTRHQPKCSVFSCCLHLYHQRTFNRIPANLRPRFMLIESIDIQSDGDEDWKCEIEDGKHCTNDGITCFEKLTRVQQAQIRKQTDKNFFCKRHLKKQFRLFTLHQIQCCDPLGVHEVAMRLDLRGISEHDFDDFGHILDVAVGQKLCRGCKTVTIPEYLRNYHENSENQTNSECQNTLSRVDDLPMDSSHSSAGYSEDIRVQNAREAIKIVSNTLNVPNNVDGRLSRKRYLNETFDRITDSLTKKVKILNPEFEGSSILLEEARAYREIIQQLKDKLSTCENSRQRYLLLTVLPRTWNAYRIQQVMGVSQVTAKRAKELMENQGILCLVPTKSGRVLDPRVLQMIEDCYLSDDMSRIQPGKNDYVLVFINGNKVERQERLLLCNLKEFAEARPANVILAGATGTHTVCVCRIHQNFKLLLHALDLKSIDDQLRKWTYKDVFARIICDPPTNEYYFRQCLSCPDISSIVDEIKCLLQRESIDEITFEQWTNVDRSALETLTRKLSEVMEAILDSLPNLLKHDFIAKEQSRFVEERKKSLALGEVLAGGDFAENHLLPIQDATQDHHWNNDQVTIHPWVCYYVDENGQLHHITVLMISDHMKHDYYTVYTFQQHLIKILQEKIPSLKKVIYRLCSCGGMAFFAISHGKRPCDEVGGAFKRAATKASLQRPLDDQITTAEELFAWAQTLDTSMNIIFVPKEEIIQNEVFLNERNEGVKTIEGTRGYHSFEPLSEEKIRVRIYSSSQDYKDATVKRKQNK
ncbi:hypothetical protein QAD02_008446 [Eretmocerus hayati]|uniref:Uncharacterized protein n=1 Tax=Eretmocerus hayati TaxID=131215 RepID=A0ACC2N8W9_9HYME|nr:hypothetical protein QAD02_008446 [Eretmocerus hayati]